ncbi:MFS transporter [Microbulbifer sp. JMSA004]|uniref:MFS transporter n=1 Tax=Microbulbifer sp. JMSA004 TaxID=3243370 RepID=UPI00403A235E
MVKMTKVKGISEGQIWGLSVLFLSVFLIASDFTAFSPALPAIAEDFSVRISFVHWVVNAYALAYGVIIVTSGRLADIYGREKIFLIGIFIFSLSSLLGGLANEVEVLLIARALMGLGGALAWSAMLGMVYTLLPSDRAGFVGGFILAALGVATACGPVIGGILSDFLSWRWILFINIPIAILVVAFYGLKYPKEKYEKKVERIDYLGVLTLSLSLFLFLLALDFMTEKTTSGILVVCLLVVSLISAISFIIIESYMADDALIPASLVTNRIFMVSGVSVFFVAIAFFAILVYIPLLFISVHHYSAFQAGLALLPAMVSSGIFAFVSGAIHERFGPKLLLCSGALAMSLGLFMLSVHGNHIVYLVFVPGMLLIGIGLGIFSPAAVTAAITSVEASKSSLSGAVVYMFRFLGGAVGLGINSAILASAPDIAAGVNRALLVDGFIVLIGFLISLLFFQEKKGR